MNVYEAIGARRSIRNYLDRPVEEDKLLRVLDAGRRAPSARNAQEWKFCVARDKATRQKLMAAARNQAFVGEAAVVIAACAVETNAVMSCGQLAYPIDVAIAVDHMTLAAVEEGLGTCWVGAFYEDQVKQILGIPATVRVVQLLALGYPKSLPEARPRKPLGEIVCYDRWS